MYVHLLFRSKNVLIILLHNKRSLRIYFQYITFECLYTCRYTQIRASYYTFFDFANLS